MRYSRRRGPAAIFELTAPFTLITGLTISRYWDEGELLISFHARTLNVCGFLSTFQLCPYLDGVAILAAPPAKDIPNGSDGSLSATILQPITQGPHTIQLFASGNAAPGDIIPIQYAELVVVQLGVWDSDRDIITL